MTSGKKTKIGVCQFLFSMIGLKTFLMCRKAQVYVALHAIHLRLRFTPQVFALAFSRTMKKVRHVMISIKTKFRRHMGSFLTFFQTLESASKYLLNLLNLAIPLSLIRILNTLDHTCRKSPSPPQGRYRFSSCTKLSIKIFRFPKARNC